MMKNIHTKLMLGCSLVAGVLCACEDRIEGIVPDPPEVVVPETSGIKLKTPTVKFDASGIAVGVEVRVVGSDWKAYKGEENCDWLQSIEPAEGRAGNNIIGLKADVNDAMEERNTYIVIEHVATGDTVHVEVGQYTYESKYNHQTDSLALVAVYKALGGEDWMDSWDLRKPMDTWNGVQLEEINGEKRVTGISIMQFSGLFGDLPNELGNLRELKLLEFTGLTPSTLPVTLTSLRKLETINIAFTSGSWFVPENAGNMKSLRTLYLGQMGIHATSFDRLYNISTLETITSNGYEGDIPQGISALRNLVTLDLSMSKVSSLPDDFGRLPKLESLYLSGCTKLTTLGNSFGQLRTLKELDLTSCSRLEQLPEDVGNLSALTQFQLRATGIRRLPESFANLTQFASFELNGCENLARLNSNIGSMQNLVNLDLSGCSSLIELPESFARLPLTELKLSDCSALKALPENIGEMKKVVSVDLTGCTALTSLPESFGQLSALKQFKFSGSGSVVLPPSFGNLTNLEEFSCSNYSAGGKGIQADLSYFGKMSRLTVLEASYNNLTGSLSVLKNLPMLEVIQLDYNPIDKAVNFSEFLNENITEIRLEGNGHTGTLEGIGKGTSLTRFYVAGNKLSGVLPEELKQCGKIQYFDVANNDLTGNIPAFVAEMSFSYGGLKLVGNRMSGVIPAEVIDCDGWKSKWYPDSNILPQQDGYGFTVE